MQLSHIALLPESIEYHSFSHPYGGHEESAYTLVQNDHCQDSWNEEYHSQGLLKLNCELDQTIEVSEECWRTSFDGIRESTFIVNLNMGAPSPERTPTPLQTPRIIRQPRRDTLNVRLDLSSLFKSDITSSPSDKRIVSDERGSYSNNRSNLLTPNCNQPMRFVASDSPRQSHTFESNSNWDSDSDSESSSDLQSITTSYNVDADEPNLALRRTCVSYQSRACPIPLRRGRDHIKISPSSREDITIRECRHWPTYVPVTQGNTPANPIITSTAVSSLVRSRTSVRCLSWLSQVQKNPDRGMTTEHSLPAYIPPTQPIALATPSRAPAPKILRGLAITITSPTSSSSTSGDDESIQLGTPFPSSFEIEKGRPIRLWPDLGPRLELDPSPEIQNEGGYEHTPLEALFDWDLRHSKCLSDGSSRSHTTSHTKSSAYSTSPRPEIFSFKPPQIRLARGRTLRRLSVSTQGRADIMLSRSHFDNDYDRATLHKHTKSLRTGLEAFRDLLARVRSTSMSTP